jgi:hypothetical protein
MRRSRPMPRPVPHPLDDAPEAKLFDPRGGPMPRGPAVRRALLLARLHLLAMGLVLLLVLVRWLAHRLAHWLARGAGWSG